MSEREHIDDILNSWPYEPHTLTVRIRQGSDGRDVLQMRLDLGLLQLETTGRPDGTRPGGHETYWHYLVQLEKEYPANPPPADAAEEVADLVGDETDDDDDGTGSAAAPDGFVMDEEQCREADQEFVQYYHRRLCWLAMREFTHAMNDADHTLRLMDFCRDHSADEDWTVTHEQYRPFVLFHRTQAAALAQLEMGNGAEASVEEINAGLEKIQAVFVEHEAEEEFETDELVVRLVEMREGLRKQFDVGNTLEEQLREAVENEKYELAAKLRDELARRRGH
jgi:hypothetical protein